MLIRPARRLRGRLRVPGDKSISHRAAIIAALARGRTRITNYSTAADCASTLRCLEGLGVRVGREGETVWVEGAGTGEPGRWACAEPRTPLDCGNSGTTMRLLAGVLAGQPFASVLTGDESLRSRPMGRVVEPLELMGARVGTQEGGRAPLRVEGRRPLRAIDYQLPVASAQVKSCVLLAGLAAEGSTAVTEVPGVETRDHTERMLDWFGVPVERRHVERGYGDAPGLNYVVVRGPSELHARGGVVVPGDLSSAAFFLAAAATLPDSDLFVEGVGFNSTRGGVLLTLMNLGAAVEHDPPVLRSNEPVADMRVTGPRALRPRCVAGQRLTLNGAAVASMIDELPLLAVVGTRVEGGLVVRDAAELRVKESDRISAVVSNLRAMGAEVEEYEDGFAVAGPTRLRGARLDSYGDHRIAMAFSVAALAAEGETEIVGAEECVGVSFPEFFALLESVVER